MKKTSFMLSSLLALMITSCGTSTPADPYAVALDNGISTFSATPHNSKNLFVPMHAFSSEFNGAVKNDNFEKTDRPFATWTMRPENVLVENGNLTITAKYDKHMSESNKQFYFSSGMLESRTTTGYGYYEARIKGADLWPGVCPAFWISGSLSQDKIAKLPVDGITNSEIDIIELQQVATSKNILALNLHTGAIKINEEGKREKRSLKAGIIPNVCKTEFPVEWNPEEDYHIYACENRPDSIIFYIDNVRVGQKPNLYWHVPMTLKISMGMRTPYERYEAWDRFAVPATEQEAKEAGFPTTMYVDYVRSYSRDYSEFKSSAQLFDIESSGYDQKKVDEILKTRKENL